MLGTKMSKISDEILNDFIARLEANGHSITSKAEHKFKDQKIDQEHTKYRNDVQPRADSLSIKDIEGLYGKDISMTYEYENNIMEAAHPKPLVMFPAYDKMNALVENENERQKINLNILRRPVSGLEFRRKYANELMQALVAVANDMDFQDKEQLRKLADQTIHHFRKEAGWLDDIEDKAKSYLTEAKDIGEGAWSGEVLGTVGAGLIGGILGSFADPIIGPEGTLAGAWAGAKLGAKLGPFLGGISAALFKTGPTAKNIQINAKIAQDKLNRLISDHTSDLFLTSLSNELTHIQSTANAYSTLVEQAGSHGSGSDIAMAQKIGQNYANEIDNLDRMIGVFIANAKSGQYASGDGGALDKIKSTFTDIFGDKLTDTIRAMEVLETVSHQAKDGIADTQRLVQAAAARASSTAPTTTSEPDQSDLLKTLQQYIEK